MNYSRPELGERLAADYALGTMPPRARRRLERAMAGDATLAATVAAWTERLAPLDEISADEAPAARIWRTIKRRIAPLAPAPAPVRRRSGAVSWWPAFVASTIAACAAIMLYVALSPEPLPNVVTAWLDKIELPSWITSPPQRVGDAGLSDIDTLPASERERPRWFRDAWLLSRDGSDISGIIEPPR
jgi:anti-sigma-K factor RskA